MSDLDVMRSNLQEIYTVAHRPLTDSPTLIANLSGTRVYDTSRCWGRFWRIIYSIVWLFAGDSLRIRKLQNALYKTHEIFREHHVKIKHYIDQYDKYLKRAITGRSVKEDECAVIRSAITNWNDSTRPFLKFINRKGIGVILDIFRRSLNMKPDQKCDFFYLTKETKSIAFKGATTQKADKPKDEPAVEAQPPETEAEDAADKQTQAKQTTPAGVSTKATKPVALVPFPQELTLKLPPLKPNEDPFKTDLLESCIRYQRIIDLQGLHPDSQPHIFFEALSRMSTGQVLYHEQERKMDKFVERLNELSKDKEITIGFLHRILKSIYEIVPEADKNFARLEVELIDKGCKLFAEEDPAHIRWRNSLKPGDTITVNDGNNTEQIVLGNRIGTKSTEPDNNHFYEISNDPARVVWISIHPAMMQLKEYFREEYCTYKRGNLGVVKFLAIDVNGRCAIMERLDHPINSVAWTSTKKITQADKIGCDIFVDLIQTFIKKNETPSFGSRTEEYSPKYLMFTSNNELECSRIPKHGKFNFNALENIVFALAAKNLPVFQYIMSKSGLSEHRYAEYYNHLVHNALKGDKREAKLVGALKGKGGILDPTIIDRGKELYDETVALKKLCCERLRKHFKGKNPGNMDQKVSKAIASQYEKTFGAGILWPTLEDDVFNALTNSNDDD